jgi:hypothetical protein
LYLLKHNCQGDDDLHWVRAITVPMHLGLIDGPFMPHKLISASLVEEALCGGPLERDPLLGTPKDTLTF